MRERKARQYNEFGELVYQVGTQECFKLLQDNGWTPTKRGWPDFFCVKGDQVCAVEVKPSKNCTLKQNQLVIMGALSAKGIRCFLWSPDGGFEEVMGMTKPAEQPF